MSPITRPLEERYWPKVDKRGPDECWPWLAAKRRGGYGVILGSERTIRAVTHIAWELHHRKPFPPGMLACHSCDNPGCANPAHISPGTFSDNGKDMARKGRGGFQKRTHCKYGHEFTPENSRYTQGRAVPIRTCRACLRAHRKVQKTLRKLRQMGALREIGKIVEASGVGEAE